MTKYESGQSKLAVNCSYPQRILNNVDCNASPNTRRLSAKKGANSQKLKIANIIGIM